MTAALARRPLPQRDRHPRGDPRRPPPLPPDADALSGRIAAVAARVDRAPVSAKVVASPSNLSVAPAADGRAVDQAELRRRLARLPRRVEVPVTRCRRRWATRRPRRPTGAPRPGERPRDRARGGPEGGDRPAAAARRAALHARGRPIDVRLDRNAIGDAVAPAFAGVVRSPVSAVVRDLRVAGVGDAVEHGAPHRRRGDRAAHRAAAGGGVGAGGAADDRSPSAPPPTPSGCASASWSAASPTPHACCEPRVTNIQRAASILDGPIIPAGATFSLNTALGERTRGARLRPRAPDRRRRSSRTRWAAASARRRRRLQRGLLRRARHRHPHARTSSGSRATRRGARRPSRGADRS